ncbi:MAG: phosphonoacetaldehyde hydrolase [Pirellulales bacterium]|nr:phosphonoacetaldehyde hydrolase [Pirellulales bacterium]
MREFRFTRTYRGGVKAVVFDWAGTTVDHGSIAPMRAFIELFRRHGIEIGMAEARQPMGMQKRDHIKAIVEMPSVAQRWQQTHGVPAGETAIDAMYDDFVPLQIECVARYADPIPGVCDVVAKMRAQGILIGSNTGYNKQIMDVLAPAAGRAGYLPDCIVTSDDVAVHRPAPWMALECARRLGVYPMSAIIKVDDTVPGIEEGLNAGMWTVGVSETGNEVGLSLDELNALEPARREHLRQTATQRLAQAGAHYIIDSVADLMPCLDDIHRRLAQGESP